MAAHDFAVRYLTIDQLRNDPQRMREMNRAGLLVMIAGVTVPGKYLGGTPATLTEIQQVGHMIRGPKKLIGGPIGFGYAGEGGKKAVRQVITGFDALLIGEPAVALDRYLAGDESAGIFDYALTDPWSVAGSGIIVQHPDFPYVMCELETARGCSHGAIGRLLVLHRALLRPATVPDNQRCCGRGCSAVFTWRPPLPGRPAAGHPRLRFRGGRVTRPRART